MLDDYMIPFIDDLYPIGCYFQQDTVASHPANVRNEYFIEQGLTAMDRRSSYLDLTQFRMSWASRFGMSQMSFNCLQSLDARYAEVFDKRCGPTCHETELV